MKMASYSAFVIAGLLFFGIFAPTAKANTTNLSFDPSYAIGPFIAYCKGYQRSFESGKHYTPQSGPCKYSVPQSLQGQKAIALYWGTVGSSTLIAGDLVIFNPTLVQQDFIGFGSISQDRDFFFVIYETGINTDDKFIAYLTSGDALPEGAVINQDYYLIPWKWGDKLASEFDPVVIIPGILSSWEKNGEWVLDPITHTYDNLIDTFIANGYVLDKTIFPFGYDWKSSNEGTAHLLKNKIEDIKQICNCSKVDLIGHSMGGLVAAHYIQSDGYQNDVDQVFFVATPLSGAPYAYETWEGGKLDFGDLPKTAIMETIFHTEAREHGFNDIFSYIHGWPVVSIQELLPVNHNYLSTATTTLQYPTGYPGNLFLENLNSYPNLLKLYNRTDVRVIRANANEATVDGFVVKPSTQVSKWEHGEPVSRKLGIGDSTVPAWSIEDVLGADIVFDNTNHGGVASTSASYIFKELTGRNPNTIIGKIYSTNLRFLFVRLFSPIDMQIVAPDGKRLGKNFSNNTELNEIPNAFYSGFNTDDEYAIILNPLPGKYEVKTVGTGSGQYTIVADYSNLATTSTTETSGTTTQGQTITNTLTLSPTTTAIVLVPSTPEPTAITPDTCVADMALAYKNKWITKKAVYTTLTAECRLLKELFKTRDKLKRASSNKNKKLNEALLKGTFLAIRATLDSMDKLAKDKSVTKEGRDLITKNTTWFREHELK